MVDDLLLAGCDPQKAVHLAGLCLKPIHLATETHPDILSSLIASRSNPEEKVLQLKHEGTNSKFGLSFEKQLAKESNSNTLVRVTIAGSLLQMKKLVTAGANLNSCHKDHSILGLAIKNGHTELAQLLLESGADPNGVQPCGGTPLSLVLHPATDSNMTLREKVALIDKLVDHGAMVPALFNYAKHRINTVDYVNHMLHPQTGPPPIKGSFSNRQSVEINFFRFLRQSERRRETQLLGTGWVGNVHRSHCTATNGATGSNRRQRHYCLFRVLCGTKTVDNWHTFQSHCLLQVRTKEMSSLNTFHSLWFIGKARIGTSPNLQHFTVFR